MVISEGMTPQCIPLWKNTWDRIKQNHPSLLVTVFTIPLYKGRDENDVFRSKDFRAWHKERKSWIDVVQLGYTHADPESIRLSKPQHVLIKRGYRKIGRYMAKDVYCFKATQDRIGPYTDGVLTRLGFSAYMYHNSIVFLKNTMEEADDFLPVKTKISIDEQYPDDISKIYNKIDKFLTTMEEKGNTYTTLTRIVRNSIKGVE